MPGRPPVTSEATMTEEADHGGPCTLCGETAVVRVWLPKGCAAIETRDQRLCAQHALSCQPIETGDVLAVYHREAAIATGWGGEAPDR